MTYGRHATLRLGADLLAALTYHARRRNVSRSQLIRDLLVAGLAHLPPTPANIPPPPRKYTPGAVAAASDFTTPELRVRPLPSESGRTAMTPRCERCGATIAGVHADEAARLDLVSVPPRFVSAVELDGVARWACSFCATVAERSAELAALLVEQHGATVDENGRVFVGVIPATDEAGRPLVVRRDSA